MNPIKTPMIFDSYRSFCYKILLKETFRKQTFALKNDIVELRLGNCWLIFLNW